MLKRFFAAGAALGLIVGFAGNAKADGFTLAIQQWLDGGYV